MANINILGINITNKNKKELFEEIEGFLNSQNFNYIVTPNPEIILAAQNDEEYFNILNHANLSIPDGIGLKFASWLLFSNLKRITGADLTKNLVEYAERRGIKIALVNWSKSLSKKEDIEKYFKKNHPDLKYIVRDFDREGKFDLDDIVDFSPRILFTSLGAPYQEMFLYKNAKNIKSLRLALGIGGSFDFLTKKIKRAPKLFRLLGLEWLWRIFQEPKGRKIWRLKRIYQAVVVFPSKFIFWRFIMPFIYRKNVACLVYKKDDSGIKALVVERAGEKNHWQIIQGGVGKNEIVDAAKKEIEEELHIKNFSIIKTTSYIYKYVFQDNNVHRGSVNSRHGGYRGQKQALTIARFNGRDEEIKTNYWDHSSWKWVGIEELPNIVHDCRKKATKIFYEIAKKELEKKGDLS